MPRSGDDPRRDARHGVRIGPMVFVSGLATSPGDPWAHRKGEPRLFTLLWAIYLLLGSMATIFATRTLGPPTPASYRPGCLAMLTVLAAGATVLWPLVRLSQGETQRPVRSIIIDLGVILLPVQSVVWPMPLLTRWPWDITAAIVALITGWIVLVGGILAPGVARPLGASRVVRMAAICALVVAGPVLGAIGAARGWWSPSGPALTSPLTAPWVLAASPPNLRPAMTTAEWAAVLAPCIAAAAIWALVAARRMRSSPDRLP